MRFSRRSFVSTGLILASGVTAPRFVLADDAEVLLAKAAEDTQTAHVEIVLEAAGALKFKEKEAVKSLPTAVTARLVYDEKRLADEADGTRQTLRRYRSVEPTIRVDQTSFQPKLRTERNLVVARTAEAQPELHSPLGPMTSDEAELLQLPFQTLIVDDLLPGKTVKVGESWKHDDAVLCALLEPRRREPKRRLEHARRGDRRSGPRRVQRGRCKGRSAASRPSSTSSAVTSSIASKTASPGWPCCSKKSGPSATSSRASKRRPACK